MYTYQFELWLKFQFVGPVVARDSGLQVLSALHIAGHVGPSRRVARNRDMCLNQAIHEHSVKQAYIINVDLLHTFRLSWTLICIFKEMCAKIILNASYQTSPASSNLAMVIAIHTKLTQVTQLKVLRGGESIFELRRCPLHFYSWRPTRHYAPSM